MLIDRRERHADGVVKALSFGNQHESIGSSTLWWAVFAVIKTPLRKTTRPWNERSFNHTFWGYNSVYQSTFYVFSVSKSQGAEWSPASQLNEHFHSTSTDIEKLHSLDRYRGINLLFGLVILDFFSSLPPLQPTPPVEMAIKKVHTYSCEGVHVAAKPRN